jgi:hypothetical protein
LNIYHVSPLTSFLIVLLFSLEENSFIDIVRLQKSKHLIFSR